MADQQENSNKMDQSGNDRTEPEESRSEFNLHENSSTSTSTSAVSLDNLISDCLEMIFKRLDLNSLLNVADTCIQLKSEAIAFVEEKFDLKNATLCHNSSPSSCIYLAGKQEIKGPRSCLAFLRCFGNMLAELTFQWQSWAADDSMNPTYILNQYINLYCGESLSTITFITRTDFLRENYVNPFVKVHTIHLDHCVIGQQLPRLIDWFPNLRHLDINPACLYQLSNDMQLHFPNLQHLTIKDSPYSMGIENLLRMNPQLQSLEILSSPRLSMTQFLNIISGNTSLLKVTTKNGLFGSVDRLESMRLASEHPSIVELNIGYSFEAMDAINLIRQLNSLKTIVMRFKSNMDLTQFVQQLPAEWEVIDYLNGIGNYNAIKINRNFL